MKNYGFPIVPFPGEKFCPMAINKQGEVCSEPTVAEQEGVRVCSFHAGAAPNRWQGVIDTLKKNPVYQKKTMLSKKMSA